MARKSPKVVSLYDTSIEQHEFTQDLQQTTLAGASFAAVGITAAVTTTLITQKLRESAELHDVIQQADDTIVSEANSIVSDPNIHLFNDTMQISRSLLTTISFAGGMLSGIGTAAFSIANSMFQHYKNLDYIRHAKKHLHERLTQLDLAALMMKMKKFKTRSTTENEIIAYCKKQCLTKLTEDTLTDGGLAVTSIAAAIFSTGVLIPVILPITTMLTIATLAFGTLVTAIVTYRNRQLLKTKLDKAAMHRSIRALCSIKALKITRAFRKHKKKYQQLANREHTTDAIWFIKIKLFATAILLRLSELAKLTIALVETVATGALSIVNYAKSAVDAVINYRHRQKHMDNMPKLIAQATIPWIDQKTFYLFGETPLEKFIAAEKENLVSKHKLPHFYCKLSASKFIKKLSQKSSGAKYLIYLAIRKSCIKQLLQRDFHHFCATHQHKVEMNTQDNLLKRYLSERVASYIDNDVKISGRTNSFKMALSTGLAGSFIFPLFSSIFWSVSAGIMLISEVVTQVIARHEVQKFKNASEQLIAKALNVENLTNSTDVHSLREFITLLKPQVQVPAAKQIATVHLPQIPIKKHPKAITLAQASVRERSRIRLFTPATHKTQTYSAIKKFTRRSVRM